MFGDGDCAVACDGGGVVVVRLGVVVGCGGGRRGNFGYVEAGPVGGFAFVGRAG